jgi:hypothetical protein
MNKEIPTRKTDNRTATATAVFVYKGEKQLTKEEKEAQMSFFSFLEECRKVNSK